MKRCEKCLSVMVQKPLFTSFYDECPNCEGGEPAEREIESGWTLKILSWTPPKVRQVEGAVNEDSWRIKGPLKMKRQAAGTVADDGNKK